MGRGSVIGLSPRSAQAPARHGTPSWPRALVVALPAWLLARGIVLAAWGVAHVRHGTPSLQVWDADWYHKLGVDGYGPYGAEGSRFFPLLPSIVGVGDGLGLPARSFLLAVCWVCALLFGAAVYRLTVLETGEEPAGRRAAWLIQLVPGASILAIGYSEALAGLLSVLYFLALRHRGDTRAGFVIGALSGLARPTGLVLAVAGVAEAVRAWFGDRTASRSTWRRPAVLAIAPLAGTAAYLTWAWMAFGDPLVPYRVQSWDELRGGVASAPWEYLVRDSPGGYPWPLVLALLVAGGVALLTCARLLPVPYLVWSLPMTGLAVTAWGLHSLPRYLAAIFPLWMAVAIAVRLRWVWWTLVGVSTAGFAWVAYLNFAGGPVP